MSVSAQRARRNLVPTRSGGVTGRVSSGEANIAQITGIPNEVQPGSVIKPTVTVGVGRMGPLDDILDPDTCEIGLLGNGWKVTIFMFVDGVQEAEVNACIRQQTQQDFDFEIGFNDLGDHTVTFRVEGQNSGNLVDSREFVVRVTEDAEDSPRGPAGDDDEGPRGPLAELFDQLNFLNDVNPIVLVGLFFLLLFVVFGR